MAHRYGREAPGVERTLDRGVAEIPSFARGRLRRWTRRTLVDAPRSLVFETYLESHPADTWPAAMVRFFAARTPEGLVVRRADAWPRMCVGTRLCCGLRLLSPSDAFNVWTGVEVTAIESGRRLRYEYLEGSTTAGSNEVRFEDRAGQTLVTHRSEYCGASRLEHALIPLLEERFHGGFVDGMHAALKRRSEARATSADGTVGAEESPHDGRDTDRHARAPDGRPRLRGGGG